ncbi:hypothetical protein Pla52o_15290 [Novipirellula galeiformis]|uniref:Uncharacterized protein n=1 Tax=Novipirellula galeiformis TaxID=2528004 RepID=A0A5C6CPA7_9BACT|nr:hypothetical protein Pla52o_15290 [Novipirellula galeiformis]
MCQADTLRFCTKWTDAPYFKSTPTTKPMSGCEVHFVKFAQASTIDTSPRPRCPVTAMAADNIVKPRQTQTGVIVAYTDAERLVFMESISSKT